MNASLFSIFKSLVNSKKSGSLLIKHANGDLASILFKEGRIEGLKVGDLTGMEAGKALSMWLSYSWEFSEAIRNLDTEGAKLDTKRYLVYLRKIAQQLETIQAMVSIDSVVIRLPHFKLEGKKDFNTEEIKLLLAIDGQMTVGQLARKLSILELQALKFTYKFCRAGLIKTILAHSPMDEEATASILDSLTEFLSEQVGPAAGIIINKAFEYLESDSQLIYRSELPELIEAVSEHLDGDDGLAFKKWALADWNDFLVPPRAATVEAAADGC